MTPQNIDHLIGAIAALVSALGIIGITTGIFVYMITTIFKNE